ncbi:MAG: hypothetical protein M1405_02545 [Patescibacteria group bacterium]|nr:hypothetical protein [Patescibacteria group bacterium]
MIKKNTIVLFDIDYTLFDTKAFMDSGLKKYALYDETTPTIKELWRNVDLGIFSKGETEFQNNKLNKTGLKKYFKRNNVHIFEDKNANLKDVLSKYVNFKIFLVDDKLPVLYESKLSMPSIVTIWIKRGPFAENQQPIKNFSPDITVNSLVNLSTVVENN